MTTWILVADNARTKIFEIPGPRQPMREVRDFINPRGSETADQGAEMFSLVLGEYIDSASADRRFDALHLIAPPKFLGLLRRNLAETTRKAIDREIPRDLSRSAIKEVEAYIRGNPEFKLEGRRITNAPRR
jgi:protein required for attachment to host cells